MESASNRTFSRTAASVLRVTVVPCVTNRESCSTPADACPANMVAARSQTQEMPIVTVKVATLGNSVTQVSLLYVILWTTHLKTNDMIRNHTNICVPVFQSLSVEESLCETSTRYREATLSARQHAWSLG